MPQPTIRILAIAVLLWSIVTVSSAAEAPKAPTPEDGAVATEIEHRLSADPDVNAQTVKIDVRAGIVTLSGKVAGEDVKSKAGKIAASVPGVVDVRNEIAVGTSELPVGTTMEPSKGGPGPIPEKMPPAH